MHCRVLLISDFTNCIRYIGTNSSIPFDTKLMHLKKSYNGSNIGIFLALLIFWFYSTYNNSDVTKENMKLIHLMTTMKNQNLGNLNRDKFDIFWVFLNSKLLTNYQNIFSFSQKYKQCFSIIYVRPFILSQKI